MIDVGGAPGRYTVFSVILGVAWFPFRLYFDHGDPLARIVVLSALYGMAGALLPLTIEWMERRKRRPAAVPATVRAARDRRGAIVGLSAGVPYYGGLILLCLVTGRSWISTATLTVALATIVAIALARLRRSAR